MKDTAFNVVLWGAGVVAGAAVVAAGISTVHLHNGGRPDPGHEGTVVVTQSDAPAVTESNHGQVLVPDCSVAPEAHPDGSDRAWCVTPRDDGTFVVRSLDGFEMDYDSCPTEDSAWCVWDTSTRGYLNRPENSPYRFIVQ